MVLLVFPDYVTSAAVSNCYPLVELHIGMQVEFTVLVLLLPDDCLLNGELGAKHVCYHLPRRGALTISQQQRFREHFKFCGLYHFGAFGAIIRRNLNTNIRKIVPGL